MIFTLLDFLFAPRVTEQPTHKQKSLRNYFIAVATAAAFDGWARTRRWTTGGRYCCFATGYLLFFQTLNTGTLDYALSVTSLLVMSLCMYVMWRQPRSKHIEPFPRRAPHGTEQAP